MPTTTLRSGTEAPAHRLRLFLAIASALLLFACSDPAANPAQCHNEDAPSVANPPSTTTTFARVVIGNQTEYDATGKSTVTNEIHANLVDISAVLSTPRKHNTMNVGGPGCYGLTGLPVPDKCKEGFTEPCRPEALEADSVEVVGLATGAAKLQRTATGAWEAKGLASPLFGSGPLTVRIAGRAEKGYFPSMELQVAQPEALAVTSPAAASTLGPGDLAIRWNGTSDALMLINASLDGAPPDVGDVQCVVQDDGCTTILAGDLDAYDMKVGSPVKLSIRRESSQVKSDGKITLEVKAQSQVDMVMKR